MVHRLVEANDMANRTYVRLVGGVFFAGKEAASGHQESAGAESVCLVASQQCALFA